MEHADMTEHRAHIILRRQALARLLRQCRTLGICHGMEGRQFARAMKRQCGIS
jgi:hypothetical protein